MAHNDQQQESAALEGDFGTPSLNLLEGDSVEAAGPTCGKQPSKSPCSLQMDDFQEPKGVKLEPLLAINRVQQFNLSSSSLVNPKTLASSPPSSPSIGQSPRSETVGNSLALNEVQSAQNLRSASLVAEQHDDNHHHYRFKHSSANSSSASSSSSNSSTSSSSSSSSSTAQVIDSAGPLLLQPEPQFAGNQAENSTSRRHTLEFEPGHKQDGATVEMLQQEQPEAKFIVTTQPPSDECLAREMSLGAGPASLEELRAAAAAAVAAKEAPAEVEVDGRRQLGVGPYVEFPIVCQPPAELCRLERSNSCSQAASAAANGDDDGDELRLVRLAATPSHGGPLNTAPVTASVSHDNLAAATSARFVDVAPSENASAGPLLLADQTNDNNAQEYISSVTNASTSLQIDTNSSRCLASDCKQQAQKASSTSSRFFSSKLNTGSLWSLLSVGSATSTSALNEMPSPTASLRDSSSKQQQQQPSGESPPQTSTNNAMSNFFTRQLQFAKRPSAQSTSSSSSVSFDQQTQAGSTSNAQQQQLEGCSLRRPKYRFQVKYVGSAMLHKNFTLPMLEWIAKDIRRQTNSSLNQRQFTIPIRDIVFEIHANQLTAINCKDGHCIFVHPMHCVSKYAQLQHNPTCFSYIIRDHKEAPSFCHSFQAKSVAKVHEIFNAIREVTTRQQLAAGALIAPNNEHSNSTNRLQKSASTDGHWRSLLTPPVAPSSGAQVVNSSDQQQQQSLSKTPPANAQPNNLNFPSVHSQLHSQHQTFDGNMGSITNSTSAAAAAAAALSCAQFENSYQFEVMFVKRVKLQVRRVPPTFVDDALETLKTFEAPKQTQIKKGVTKRIISASVDERQEYDESCQSPTPGSQPAPISKMAEVAQEDEQRRGSSVSLRNQRIEVSNAEEGRESKSCQQSPAKSPVNQDNELKGGGSSGEQPIRGQSVDCLKSIADFTIKRGGGGEQAAPIYFNDFSPYNTITSSDLNERIAAIPVVSSSVSLDHETRQKVARQVRETIMATAATLKKGAAYASGDKLEATGSSKVLDALSCNSQPPLLGPDEREIIAQTAGSDNNSTSAAEKQELNNKVEELQQLEQRRKSASANFSALTSSHKQQQAVVVGNNFDLFRRASARQVVKNRTMLLLIGKDELCAISIDKHQMLFSKSFNSIVHCLQGIGNKDHFGLICRDSGKINPQAESFAGYVFKCQSDKVVREIMAALKQVIYSSQHNYHGLNSPYNPLNYAHLAQVATPAVPKRQTPSSAQLSSKPNEDHLNRAGEMPLVSSDRQQSSANLKQQQISLAAKRGFVNPIEIDEAARQQLNNELPAIRRSNRPPPTAPALSFNKLGPLSVTSQQQQQPTQAKNLIKSMFCDDCPLYWFHRLCCDVESLPSEASKAIILRRIDASLTEREQDDIYSKFSEFNIESIEEHNEIFMSLLRQLAERKQLKHNVSQAHAIAMAKSAQLARQQSSELLRQKQQTLQMGPPNQPNTTTTATGNTINSFAKPIGNLHQRSGSSSGSLAQVLGASGGGGNQAALADASSTAIDNFKRAKNSISVSIENLLKRRASLKDDGSEIEGELLHVNGGGHFSNRSGSFKGGTRELRAANSDLERRQGAPNAASNLANANEDQNALMNLRRSQSTSDYSRVSSTATSWCDSLRRTLNDDLTSSLVSSFTRRGSFARSETGDHHNQREVDQRLDSKRTSTDSLSANNQPFEGLEARQAAAAAAAHEQQQQPATFSAARWMQPPRALVAGTTSPNSSQSGGGGGGPSSYLSGAFWKKSIFDKIHQSNGGEQQQQQPSCQKSSSLVTQNTSETPAPIKRTRAELRALWRKAILEQITLLKMDKQNQKLQANAAECNVQRMKLNYRDIPFGKEATQMWDKLLKQDPRLKVPFVEVAKLVRLGVPKQRRGEVWMFLMNQYQLRHGISFQPPPDSEFKGDADQTYRSLLSQLSTQQHEIFVDIGRTFPAHPYYSQYLSIGQLSLFNLLKAYSLLDKEVGYCQGLSFVAGILLLHVDSEDEAFELMRHLLFNFGLRKQYLPSMNALHLQLYQLTRLLRDFQYEIFHHFDQHDISPSLYAAPWFLTMFASQFPLGFVARLLDLIYLTGIEAIFRVSLMLLAYHRESLLKCTSLEASMDFMRRELVKVDDINMAKIFHDASTLDLRNKLIEYEIEYSFYCAEDKARASSGLSALSLASSHYNQHHHNALASSRQSANSSSSTVYSDVLRGKNNVESADSQLEEQPQVMPLESSQHLESNNQLNELALTSDQVADATATVIIQHLLANNHLRTLRTNYSY